jgi:hypothetical protein
MHRSGHELSEQQLLGRVCNSGDVGDTCTMPPASSSQGQVWTYRSRQNLRRDHEAKSIAELAKRIAKLQGMSYGGDCGVEGPGGDDYYIIPDETLQRESAQRLGIWTEQNFFGGVVPYEFVATKVITHPLYDRDAKAPDGFSRELGHSIKPAVLSGFTAFSEADALTAGAVLLKQGSIRLKPSREKGGLGQVIIRDEAELRSEIGRCDSTEMSKFGLVLEENLNSVETCSVGFISIGAMTAAYFGTQTVTSNNHGGVAYGGSELFVLSGGSADLCKMLSNRRQRLAVEQAIAYDREARRCYESIFASRRNYDVAQGIDARGNWKSGVLEQSWRIGGASPAEVTAFEAFQRDPNQKSVRVCCVERYGEDFAVPARAQVYYQGFDEHAGPMTKYALALP